MMPVITRAVPTRASGMVDAIRGASPDRQSDTTMIVKSTSAPTSATADRRWSARIQSFRLTRGRYRRADVQRELRA